MKIAAVVSALLISCHQVSSFAYLNDTTTDALKTCLGGSQLLLDAKLKEMKVVGKNMTDPACMDQALKGCLAQRFVEDQFKHWKGHQCDKFIDSFTDDFNYCDVTPCTNDKSIVGGGFLCDNTAVTEIHEIDLVVRRYDD